MTKENCHHMLIIISSYVHIYSDRHIVIFCLDSWVLHLSCTMHSQHSLKDTRWLWRSSLFHWTCPISHDRRLFCKENCRRSQFPASSHGESQLGELKLEVTDVSFLQVVLLLSLTICEASPLFLDEPYQTSLNEVWFNFWDQFFFFLLGQHLVPQESGADYQILILPCIFQTLPQLSLLSLFKFLHQYCR